MNNLDSKSGSFLLEKGFAEEQQIHFTVFKRNSQMIRVPNWPFSEANFFFKNAISISQKRRSCMKLISDD